MKIHFLGGVGTVTGSKYLLEHEGRRILVDCGLFQGLKELRLRNWAPLSVDPSSIDMVVLTHAHIDHSGYLPLLVKNGFSGPIYATRGSVDLCSVLLPDSGYLMERDADYANRKGFSKHSPAEPLYTREDAMRALDLFRPVDFDESQVLFPDVKIKFHKAGHILGAAIVELWFNGKKIVFSGDIGRYDDPIMCDPTVIKEAHYLLVESTYGDRFHERDDPMDIVSDIINRTAARGGTVLIPSFAVGRAQTLLYILHQLKHQNRIPDLPVFLDSPMAINATHLYCKHSANHRLSLNACEDIFSVAEYVHRVEDSKAITQSVMPKVIISASGMATGGRVLHHLRRFGQDEKSTILFAGYQAAGTRGDRILRGEKEVKMFGQMIPIKAEVDQISSLSAHADQEGLMRWLSGFEVPPHLTFITHGEGEASQAFAERVKDELGWKCTLPTYNETIELT